MIKVKILSIWLFHYHHLTPVQTQGMILCCFVYITYCFWISHPHHFQGHREALVDRSQASNLTQSETVRIIYKTVAILELICFSSNIAIKQFRWTSFAKRIWDSVWCLASRRADLIQSWSVFACFATSFNNIGSWVACTSVYSLRSSVITG